MEIIPIGVYSLKYLDKNDTKEAIFISVDDTVEDEYTGLISNFINETEFIDYLILPIADIPVCDGISEEDMLKKFSNQMHFMTEDDANKIVSFVLRYRNTAMRIYIQCSAGASRSPSIAAALDNWLNSSDIIFNNPQFAIKKVYYDFIIEAIKRLTNDIARLRKFKHIKIP